MERKYGQIDIFPLNDDLMHRRLLRRNLDHGLRGFQTFLLFLPGAVHGRSEGGREATTVTRYAADDFNLLWACLAKQNRLWRRLDDPAQLRQRHWFIVDLDLAHLDQLIDEGSE